MKPARPIDMDNVEVKAMDRVIAENPPDIRWRFDPVRRVQVVWYMDDPHADQGGHNGMKTHCKNNHPFDEANTIATPTGRQCRTCKNEMRKPLTPEQKQRALELKRQRRQAKNTSLLTAARTEI